MIFVFSTNAQVFNTLFGRILINNPPILSATDRIAYTTLHETPKFHLISWCGNFVETESFCRVLGGGTCVFPQSF